MAAEFKELVKRIPLVRTIARRALELYNNATFSSSADYWRQRYVQGGNSGRGSYGQFAEFKAETVNGLVREFRIQSIVEFGCGDGAQLALGAYPKYVGLDVSPSAIQLCRRRFADDRTKSFFLYDSECFVDHGGLFSAELSLSLDVIYHLTEDRVFEAYMTHLFGSATRFVLIYSNDDERPSRSAHIRFRRFSEWVGQQALGWSLHQRIPNRFPFTGDERTGSPSEFFLYSRSASVERRAC
jgi:SAM-dependent methyltransferase